MDLYRGFHKGIRAMLAHLISRASRLSFDDAASVATFRDEVDYGFALLSSYAALEEDVVHPLLARGGEAVIGRACRRRSNAGC